MYYTGRAELFKGSMKFKQAEVSVLPAKLFEKLQAMKNNNQSRNSN